MIPVTVRYAELKDVPSITEIYNDYVVYTTSTFDVTPKSVEDRTAWYYEHPRDSRYKLLVAEQHAVGVIGFTATSPFRPKEAYRSSVETTVYVARNMRSRGIGAQLYQRLFDELGEEDLHRAYACISLPNPASLALHEKFDFTPVGIFHEAGKKFGRYVSIQWLEKQF